MLQKIRGIVLRTVKYGDTSLIVDMFTDTHGRMSFITKVGHAKRSVRTMSLWQPLAMLEFEADIRHGSTRLPRPSDVRQYYSYSDLPYSPVKSSLCIFLAEFLNAALREEKANEPLYLYLQSSFQWLDIAAEMAAVANFHLVFLMHLSRFIGVYPNMEDHGKYFDLLAGTFTYIQPSHSHYLKPDEAHYLPVLFRMNYSTMHLFHFSRAARLRILAVLNTYYRLHVPQFPELKSLEVLHELFS